MVLDRSRIRCHIVPLIGKLTAKDLTCAQVQRMVDGISAGRTAGHFRKGSVIEGGAGVAALRDERTQDDRDVAG